MNDLALKIKHIIRYIINIFIIYIYIYTHVVFESSNILCQFHRKNGLWCRAKEIEMAKGFFPCGVCGPREEQMSRDRSCGVAQDAILKKSRKVFLDRLVHIGPYGAPHLDVQCAGNPWQVLNIECVVCSNPLHVGTARRPALPSPITWRRHNCSLPCETYIHGRITTETTKKVSEAKSSSKHRHTTLLTPELPAGFAVGSMDSARCSSRAMAQTGRMFSHLSLLSTPLIFITSICNWVNDL